MSYCYNVLLFLLMSLNFYIIFSIFTFKTKKKIEFNIISWTSVICIFSSVSIQTMFLKCFRLELYLTFLFTALSISMEKNSGLIERSLSSGLYYYYLYIKHIRFIFLIKFKFIFEQDSPFSKLLFRNWWYKLQY